MRLFPALFWMVWHYALIGGHCIAEESSSVLQIIPQNSGVVSSFRGLAVRNKQEAWVTGSDGTVIRTTDAGVTWKRVAVPDSEGLDFRDVEVLADRTIVLMSVGKDAASRILRSSDDGATWKQVLVNQDPDGFFDGMAFDEERKTGMLFGDPVRGRMALFRTFDRGFTWEPLPDQQRPALKMGEYGFAASGTGIAVMGSDVWIATGGSVARVMRSTDGGATWAASATPLRSGNESSGIFSLAVNDSRTIVVVGGDYKLPEEASHNVARSTDGGETWIGAGSVQMPHKACVRVLGQGRLLACGRTGVALSADAGASWKTISTEGYYVCAIDRDSGTGFLAGAEGRVARIQWGSSAPK
jgi:photosystem II stability/assembly factor-like uncharacterized protein